MSRSAMQSMIAMLLGVLLGLAVVAWSLDALIPDRAGAGSSTTAESFPAPGARAED